jgi:NADPH:quinone reductase-like Zn-dependent oxidoreductase
MGKMRALVFETAGVAADVLSLREVDMPSLSHGEVLVRVDARSIQPSDFMFIGGRYRITPKFPQVAGLEGTGIVTAVAPGVSIEIGRRVAFRFPGCWAEFVAVPEDRVIVAPADVAAEDVAQFSLNPITAWALLEVVEAKPGDWLAVNAATSTVAQLIEQLARARGVHLLKIVRAGSAAREPAVLAADVQGLAEKMLEVSAGIPYAGLLDSVGGAAIMNVLPALARGATIVSYGALESGTSNMSNPDMIYRNLTWKGFGIDHWLATSKARRAEMMDELWQAIRTGTLKLSVRARYALTEWNAAIADATSAGKSGKVLITN